jgi:hypothetical protein
MTDLAPRPVRRPDDRPADRPAGRPADRPDDRPDHSPARRVGRRTPGTAARLVRCRVARDERGITTAEYAVGTAAGAGLAGLLYKLLTGGFGEQLLRTLFDHVLNLLGIG